VRCACRCEGPPLQITDRRTAAHGPIDGGSGREAPSHTSPRKLREPFPGDPRAVSGCRCAPGELQTTPWQVREAVLPIAPGLAFRQLRYSPPCPDSDGSAGGDLAGDGVGASLPASHDRAQAPGPCGQVLGAALPGTQPPQARLSIHRIHARTAAIIFRTLWRSPPARTPPRSRPPRLRWSWRHPSVA
jgi:hypothetical protein